MSNLTKKQKIIQEKHDPEKTYSLEEAMDIIQSVKSEKFDESIDISVKLGVDPDKSDQNVRGAVTLPNSLGKEVKVAVFADGDHASDAQTAGAEYVGMEDLAEKFQNDEVNVDVVISTNSAIKEMVLPGVLAIISPVFVGFIFGPETLGGLLAGVTVSGVLMAIFQSNAGGAWDNAKKMIEEGIEIDGKKASKGSEAHKSAVVGDTVGDPFKDTSGPSLNILIKLMSVVSLVIAPLIAGKI